MGGNSFAGGVFGTIAAGHVIGLLVGPVFAGFFGVPVIGSFAIITWAFWLMRIMIPLAALAGGCTGLIASALTTDFPTSLPLASLIGALGGGGATGLYWTTHGRHRCCWYHRQHVALLAARPVLSIYGGRGDHRLLGICREGVFHSIERRRKDRPDG